jgi:hypothetical protein
LQTSYIVSLVQFQDKSHHTTCMDGSVSNAWSQKASQRGLRLFGTLTLEETNESF